jgi:hypothetical protein
VDSCYDRLIVGLVARGAAVRGVTGCSRSGPACLDTQAGACLVLVEVLAVVASRRRSPPPPLEAAGLRRQGRASRRDSFRVSTDRGWSTKP